MHHTFTSRRNERKFLLRTILLASVCSILVTQRTNAQTISDVSLRAENDKVLIKYYLSPSKENQSYDVTVRVSSDGGDNFISPHSVSGDVGTVSGSGWKNIYWNVFEDVDLFDGDACIAKVEAEEIRTTVDVLSDIFIGNEKVKDNLNGFIIHAGWNKTSFLNSTFKNAIDNGIIKNSGGIELGIKYAHMPFNFDINFFTTSIDAPTIGDSISHRGMNFSLSLLVLPSLQYVVPSIISGYQFSAISMEEFSSPTSQANTSSLFYGAGVEINFHPLMKIVGEYKRSIGLEKRNWDQLFISIGCNYSSYFNRL
ncbi:MAG: hypothetical protein FJ218_06245 [Ignavibacteria bacterium]|nr:hypothetical protein [Ignavibacteria bacterium]